MLFERYRKARDEAQGLDLLPVMNLMVVLIPFLMLGAAFYHLGVIPTSLPTKVDHVLDKPQSEDVVTLNLLIERGRMVVTGSSATLDAAVLGALRRELPAGPDGAPAVADLQAHLATIKAQYPKSDTVVVFPGDDVRYQTLVEILDTTREHGVPQAQGDPIVTPLFPVTVFSRPPVPDFDGADGGVEAAPDAGAP